jgi:hypothetical protein
VSFNKYKGRKNIFNNFIKHLFFGKEIKERKIIFGKARGIKMFINPAYKIQRLIGTEEREIQNIFVRLAKKCSCFFDVGASDGYYSLLYKKYNSSGVVYLFETDEKFGEVQKAHFEMNNIHEGFHQCFKFVSGINDDNHISLDHFDINDKALFKIDVEGAERWVLEGMKNLLENYDCYLIIETHSEQLEKDCIHFLQENKYQTLIIKNAWWRLILGERRPLKQNRWLVAYKEPDLFISK